MSRIRIVFASPPDAFLIPMKLGVIRRSGGQKCSKVCCSRTGCLVGAGRD
jgi:hypothetical protein